MIDRGPDNSSSGDLNATLKTKYEDGQLRYVFSVVHPNKSELDWGYYDKFSFELIDKDGFIITTVEASNYVNIVENKKIYGINSNSNQYLPFSDYLKIKSWQLVYTTKY